MHIVALAWIYVTLMMALTEHTLIAGIMTFLLYGICPLFIVLYLIGTPARKRNKVRRELALQESMQSGSERIPEKK